MKQLFRPTLVRRVFVSLLAACSLIWLLLMALNLADNMGDARTSEELASLSDYVADGLEQIDDDKSAAAFVLGAVGETRRDAYKWRNFHALKYQLTDRSGQVLATTRAFRPALAEKAFVLDGMRYLAVRRSTQRWTLVIAMPLHSLEGIVRDDWLALLIQVLMVFPFIFIAAWIAIARGLRPLRQLSDSIAARSADDLTPVKVDPKFDELKPLVAALDSLLQQLRNKVSREHAFVQDAAHELRTPLAVISAQAHVQGMANSAEERRSAEQHMDQAIARAAHLIHQLLDLAKMDHRQHSAGACDVVALVRQELAVRVATAMKCGLDLSLDAPDSLALDLDPQAFLSVLANLVDNALRYVERGGRVVVEIRSNGTGLCLAVADNGPGIAADQRALVFERFHRVSGNDAPGSGLGLAIARRAAERMGGALTLAEGLDGKGCRFELTLPGRPPEHRHQ